MSPKAKAVLNVVVHALALVVGLGMIVLGIWKDVVTLQATGGTLAVFGLLSFSWGHAILGQLGSAQKLEQLRPLLDGLPPSDRVVANIILSGAEITAEDIAKAAGPKTPAGGSPGVGHARLGMLVGLTVGAAALLLATQARAQVEDGPAGCAGFTKLHCGAGVSFISLSLRGTFAFQPAVGPDLDYHFEKWILGVAFLNGAVVSVGGQTAFTGTLAPFAALGDLVAPPADGSWSSFLLKLVGGMALGGGFDVYGSAGGVFKHWNWRDNFRVYIGGTPDLINALQALPGVKSAGQLPSSL